MTRTSSGSDPDKRQRARIGAYALHAQRDSREITRPAREAFLEKFRREVDPEDILDEEDRERRARRAMRAHMLRLARLSAAKRRSRNDR